MAKVKKTVKVKAKDRGLYAGKAFGPGDVLIVKLKDAQKMILAGVVCV